MCRNGSATSPKCPFHFLRNGRSTSTEMPLPLGPKYAQNPESLVHALEVPYVVGHNPGSLRTHSYFQDHLVSCVTKERAPKEEDLPQVPYRAQVVQHWLDPLILRTKSSSECHLILEHQRHR